MTADVYGVNTRSYHHGDLRRALLDGALELLGEAGLEGLSLRAVAKRAGVSPMAPYRHFADKAALLSAVAQHGFVLLRDRLLEVNADRQGSEAVVAEGVAYVTFAAEHPDLYRLMFARPPTWSKSEANDLAERPDTSFGILAQEMRALFPPAEVELAILTAWSFIHGLASLVVDRRLNPFPPDLEALARQATQFFAERFLSADR